MSMCNFKFSAESYPQFGCMENSSFSSMLLLTGVFRLATTSFLTHKAQDIIRILSKTYSQSRFLSTMKIPGPVFKWVTSLPHLNLPSTTPKSVPLHLKWVRTRGLGESERHLSREWCKRCKREQLKYRSSHQPDLSTIRLFLKHSTKVGMVPCWRKRGITSQPICREERLPPHHQTILTYHLLLHSHPTTQHSRSPAPLSISHIKSSPTHCRRLAPPCSLLSCLPEDATCVLNAILLLVKYFQFLRQIWSWIWTNLKRYFALCFFPIILNLNVFYEKSNPYVSD